MTVRVEAIVTLVILVVIAGLVAKAMDRWLLKRTRVERFAVAFGLSILCLPGLWFCAYYLHILPESKLLYDLRSARFSELWLIALLPTAVAWGTFLPRPVTSLCTAFVLIVMLLPFYKPVFMPLDASKLGNQWRGKACLQSTGSTCGPASAATVLRSLGDAAASESEIARESWTSMSGTEAWFLARTLRQRGRVVDIEFNGLPSPDHLPGILGVKLGSFGHFIAVLKNDGDQWTIADPVFGEETLTRRELERRYMITPFFMRVR